VAEPHNLRVIAWFDIYLSATEVFTLNPHPAPEDDRGALRPLTRVRLYEELQQRLVEYAREAGLKVGDGLPPERTLAERLGVSRASVRQAIVALEVQGIVEVRHGNGIFLLRTDAAEPLNKLLDRRQRLPEILEAREALETKLAELAALRRTDRDLAEMDLALRHMEDDIAAGGIGSDADADFHLAVTQAAKSAVLGQLMKELDPAIRETRVESLRQPGRPPKSLAAHRKIVDRIRRGDAAAAAQAMKEHLKVVADVRLLQWSPREPAT
jgi:GntR family transcriptional regulator, transcriptional repressor for pyruvate dehydrogenase complex